MDKLNIAACRFVALDDLKQLRAGFAARCEQLRAALNASLRKTGLAPACAELPRPA
jgi:hypothetical protein